MSEIKFKAFIKSKNKTIDVFGFNKNYVFEDTYDSVEIGVNVFERADVELLRYTGFEDKNGKEIYEGYIIEYVSINRDEHKVRDIIEFDEECGGWYLRNQAKMLSDVLHEQHNEEWQKWRGYIQKDKHKVRVVGNIYEK